MIKRIGVMSSLTGVKMFPDDFKIMVVGRTFKCRIVSVGNIDAGPGAQSTLGGTTFLPDKYV